MVWYQPGVAGQYNAVAAGQTNKFLGNTGKAGDYLEGFTVIAGTTTPGAVTLKDGTTAVISVPAGTATVLPYNQYFPVRAYSTTGGWNFTTGTNVTIFATGQFS
jgi:hypothetical protein